MSFLIILHVAVGVLLGNCLALLAATLADLAHHAYLRRNHRAEVAKKRPRRRKKLGRWSEVWRCCRDCLTTEHPHHGKGLCRGCYWKQYARPPRRK